jgi:hypothetical protein
MDIKDIKDFLEENKDNKDVKQFISSLTDRTVTKAIQTYKSGHLETDVKNALREQDEQFEKRKTDLLRKELFLEQKEIAIAKALENGVNPKVAVHFAGADTQTTIGNLNELFKDVERIAEQRRLDFLHRNAHIPQAGQTEKPLTLETIKARAKNPEWFSANKNKIMDFLEGGK